MARTTRTSEARTPRWLRLLLFISLALNLVVLGMVAGTMIMRGRHHPPPVVLRELSFGAYTEALSPEDREALRRGFHDAAPAFREMRQTQRLEQQHLLEALRTTPFVPTPVREVLAGQRERVARGIEMGQAALLERIEAMSDAERAAFADRLEAILARPHSRSRGGRERPAGQRNPDGPPAPEG